MNLFVVTRYAPAFEDDDEGSTYIIGVFDSKELANKHVEDKFNDKIIPVALNEAGYYC